VKSLCLCVSVDWVGEMSQQWDKTAFFMSFSTTVQNGKEVFHPPQRVILRCCFDSIGDLYAKAVILGRN
jgi:hypothetical protein